MKNKIVLFGILFCVLSISFISAASDVAYIYRKDYKIDENVIDVFNKMGLSVETIREEVLYKTNLNNYRILFVGDERFLKSTQIPVHLKPTIVANYYHGFEFGLTDVDGISKLAATTPLSVKKGDQIIQVYTQAFYKSGSTSAIPYYYLYDENKAPGMTSVARTYTGGINGYDFGDVISYANSGIKLFNGKTSQEKICFYGIIESDFWTSAAKQMFEDCVGFVGIACYSDDECPEDEIGNNYCSNSGVYQDNIQYTCENAGTVQSQCVANAVAELVEDCGESYYGNFGDDYCKNNDVFHNRTYYELGCFNGNCIDSTSINEELVEECGAEEVCMNGKCEVIACYVDSDCDDSDEYTVDVCNNPGTPESYCSHVPRECLTDTDCNEDYYGEN